MNKDDFDKWYRENIDVMANLGVFHPESQSGKTVHLAIASVRPEILMINERINRLENMIRALENIPDEIKEQIQAPVKEIKMTVEGMETKKKPKAKAPPKKPAAPKTKTASPSKKAAPKKPKAQSGGWQINKR